MYEAIVNTAKTIICWLIVKVLSLAIDVLNLIATWIPPPPPNWGTNFIYFVSQANLWVPVELIISLLVSYLTIVLSLAGIKWFRTLLPF